MARRALGAMSALAVLLSPLVARAGTTIVVEFSDGDANTDADRELAPVIAALKKDGAIAGAAASDAFEERVSRPGAIEDAAASVTDLVDQGFQAWTDGRFDEAVEKLGRVVDIAKKSSATLLVDGDFRAAYRKALIGLALSHKRLGHQLQAGETMAEFLRSFPDTPLKRLEYGPEAFKLYTQVQAAMGALGTGSLAVSIDDADVIAFVNEQYVADPMHVKNLSPGVYRVLIRKGRTAGRLYTIEVRPNETATLDVMWQFDQSLQTSSSGIRFQFPDAATRDRLLATYATRCARLWGADTVVTLGVGAEESRRSVIGKVFTIDNVGPGAHASVAIEPVEPSADRLAMLGDYLAGVRSDPPPPDPPPQAEGVRGGSWGGGWLKWSTGGLAVAAFGVGVGLVAADGKGTCSGTGTCPRVWDTKPAGMGLLGGGVALSLVTSYLFAHDAGAPSERKTGWTTRRIALVSGVVVGGASIIGGGYALYLDGKGTCSLEPCYKNYGTKYLGTGLVIGGAIVASVAAEVLWHDGRASPRKADAHGLALTSVGVTPTVGGVGAFASWEF